MLKKIHLLLLVLFTGLMSFLMYYAWSWTQSIGSPQAAVEGYLYHAGLGRTLLWLSTVILLIVANIIFWQSRSAWAMWLTLLYFAFYTVIRFFVVGRSALALQAETGTAGYGAYFGPFLGVILIATAAGFVYVNQLVSLRLNERMYPISAQESLANEDAESVPPVVAVGSTEDDEK